MEVAPRKRPQLHCGSAARCQFTFDLQPAGQGEPFPVVLVSSGVPEVNPSLKHGLWRDFQGRFSGQEEGETSTLKKTPKKNPCALFHAFAKWNPLNQLYVYFLKGYKDLCQYLHDSTWFSTGD